MKKVLGVSFLCLLLDQVTKLIVTYNMALGNSIVVIKDFFNITYVLNDGAAWSILSGKSWLLILIALIALNVIYIFFIYNKKLRKLEIITYGVLIGGIIGNLVDRILYGKVIDFLDFNIFGYNYPVFNIADICICISVFLLIISMVRSELNERNSRKREWN